MKALFEKFYRSKVVLTSVVVFLVMISIVYAYEITSDDTDGDGVANAADLCPNTIIDKPGGDWGGNRYLWVGADFFTLLDVQNGAKNQTLSDYTMAQTKGCSCIDIVKMTSRKEDISKNNNYVSGCTRSTLDSWIRANTPK